MSDVGQLFRDQAVTIGVSGDTVTVQAENAEDAGKIFDWLASQPEQRSGTVLPSTDQLPPIEEAPESEPEYGVKWISDNLDTRKAWDGEDYREFYDRDVPFLLAELRRLREENVRFRKGLAKLALYLFGGHRIVRHDDERLIRGDGEALFSAPEIDGLVAKIAEKKSPN